MLSPFTCSQKTCAFVDPPPNKFAPSASTGCFFFEPLKRISCVPRNMQYAIYRDVVQISSTVAKDESRVWRGWLSFYQLMRCLCSVNGPCYVCPEQLQRRPEVGYCCRSCCWSCCVYLGRRRWTPNDDVFHSCEAGEQCASCHCSCSGHNACVCHQSCCQTHSPHTDGCLPNGSVVGRFVHFSGVPPMMFPRRPIFSVQTSGRAFRHLGT